MAVARVQVATSLVGKEQAFMDSVRKGKELFEAKGLANIVRVSHSGVTGLQVWNISIFEDWKAYGETMDRVNADADMQAYLMENILNRSGEMLESFEMAEVAGFEQGVEPSGDVVMSTVWRVLPQEGMNAQFLTSCAAAKELHEKHGGRVRLWMGYGGAYSWRFIYNVGFDSFAAMGEFQQSVSDEMAAFMLAQPVSGEVEQQIVLRASPIL